MPSPRRCQARGRTRQQQREPPNCGLALETIAALVRGRAQAIPQRARAMEPSVSGRKQTNQTYLIMAGAAADNGRESKGSGLRRCPSKSILFKP